MRQTEAELQRAIVEYLRLTVRGLVIHVPNGGYRTKAEAAVFKGLGVMAGFPDILIITEGGSCHLLEVKVPGGSLSKSQRAVFSDLDRLGIPHAVVKSLDDAEKYVKREIARFAWRRELQ